MTHSLEGCCSIQLSYGQNGETQKALTGLFCSKSQKGFASKVTDVFVWNLTERNQVNGRSGGIRTRDPLLPKQMRYQAALRSDNLYSNPQKRHSWRSS